MSNTLPKQIKQKRIKSFTTKRDSYKTYLSANWTWIEVIEEANSIKNNNNNFLRTLSKKYNIKYSTLKNKYNLYCKKSTLVNIENRGGINKIFTEIEDKELYEHIKTNFIDKNTPLTNNIIKEIALDKFKTKKTKLTFNASNGWCNMFKKRWNLSTQKVKFSKKATNKPSDIEKQLFLDNYQKVSENIKNKFIFNYDETSYKIVNPPKTAIRVKGQESTKIICNNNLKANFTLGLTISSGGAFLKPLLITNGKSKRCLNKFNLTHEIIGTYTNNGWADDECIIMILDQIASITNKEKSLLLMDQYGSHMTHKVKNHAKNKNINIIYVPVGMTDKYQPLDIQINGILKCKASKSYSKYIASNPNNTYSHSMCITDFLINKKEIKKRL